MWMCRPADRKTWRPARSTHSAICVYQMPCFACLPPVLVFWLWPWPKPGFTRSVISRPGAAAELIDHVGRAAIDVDVAIDAQIERPRRRRCRPCRRSAADRPRARSRRPGAEDFAGADRIDQRPLAADEIENREIRAGLLRVADHVEGRQIGDAATDHGGVVDESGRAKRRASSATDTPAIWVRKADMNGLYQEAKRCGRRSLVPDNAGRSRLNQMPMSGCRPRL